MGEVRDPASPEDTTRGRPDVVDLPDYACCYRCVTGRHEHGAGTTCECPVCVPVEPPSYEEVLAACMVLRAAGWEVRREERVGHRLRTVPEVVVSTLGDPTAQEWRRVAVYQPWEHPPEKVKRALRAEDNQEADA